MRAAGTLRRSRRALPYETGREIAVPPYRSRPATPPQGPPDAPASESGSDDRAYLWLALAIGAIPLLGAVVCRHSSDTELGVGTAMIAIAAPTLARSYRKGS